MSDYVVRDRGKIVKALTALGITAVVLLSVALWLRAPGREGSAILPVLLLAGAAWMTIKKLRQAYHLRVSADGVAVADGEIPWPQIAEVHIAPQGLSLVLGEGAGLPTGMRGRIVDPADPDTRTRMQVHYDSGHDDGVRQAVQRHARDGVLVTT